MSNKLKKLGEKARSQPPVLKACGHCGSEAVIAKQLFDIYKYKPECTKCSVSLRWFSTEAEAIKAWNQRQPDTEWAKKHMVQLRRKIMAQQEAIREYVVENKQHRDALEWIREYHSCEFSCNDCDTPMLCSKKVAKQALLKGDEDGN